MSKFQDQEIIKEYQIPNMELMGKVQIIESADKKEGNYFGICAFMIGRIYGKSVAEVENKLLDNARRCLASKKRNLESEIEFVNLGISFVANKMKENNYTPEINLGEETK